MARGNVKMAMAAIRTSKWRSFLTMLGIIIGVVSVVTTVSLGEGIKKSIVGQTNRSGADLITILPGRSVTRDAQGQITNIKILASFNLGSLSENDLESIKKIPSVQAAVPFSYVTGIAKTDTREYMNGPIVATTDKAASLLNQKLQFGSFFSEDENNKNVAVIGRRVAEQLFQESAPIGKTVTVRDQRYIVEGVFNEFSTSPLSISTDYNSVIFIPFEASKHIAGNQEQIYQILAKPNKPTEAKNTIDSINRSLKSAHSDQVDFTVLTQAETLAVANGVLNILTSFIAGIAAISLIVGGIGIMNIMLVAVTERTSEIGVRKAIGATNGQILSQFLIEAVVLSFTGGIIGVIFSLLANYLMRVFTSLTPVITLPIVGIATLVAVIVGVIFGITPAMRAARKDPIEALRHE